MVCPQDAVQVVQTSDRAAVGKLITMTEFVDVIVPRGGKGLIARLMEEARVPMIKHLDGICHVYVDDGADIAKAMAVCDNAKTHRYGTCNTMETLLVARGIAAEVLPPLGKLYRSKEVELRVDPAARAVLEAAGVAPLVDASEEDWRTEYLAPVPGDQDRRRNRRGNRAHQYQRLRAHGRDRHRRTTTAPCASCAKWIRRA